MKTSILALILILSISISGCFKDSVDVLKSRLELNLTCVEVGYRCSLKGISLEETKQIVTDILTEKR